MSRPAAVLAAIVDFLVGDDWVTAAGIAVAVAVAAGLQGAGVAAWWVIPVAAVGVLALSLRRATKKLPDRRIDPGV